MQFSAFCKYLIPFITHTKIKQIPWNNFKTIFTAQVKLDNKKGKTCFIFCYMYKFMFKVCMIYILFVKMYTTELVLGVI
jgi:hypothetical protein